VKDTKQYKVQIITDISNVMKIWRYFFLTKMVLRAQLQLTSLMTSVIAISL